MITGKPAPLFFRNDYAQRLKKLFEPSIVSYLPLDEPGGSVAFDYSGKGRNGAYTAVTLGQNGIGDGRSAASFNGTSSLCNWHSAALAAAFNGAEGTLMAWAKVSSAGVWTDNAHRTIARVAVDTSNYIQLYKYTNNAFLFDYFAGGVAEQISLCRRKAL